MGKSSAPSGKQVKPLLTSRASFGHKRSREGTKALRAPPGSSSSLQAARPRATGHMVKVGPGPWPGPGSQYPTAARGTARRYGRDPAAVLWQPSWGAHCTCSFPGPAMTPQDPQRSGFSRCEAGPWNFSPPSPPSRKTLFSSGAADFIHPTQQSLSVYNGHRNLSNNTNTENWPAATPTPNADSVVYSGGVPVNHSLPLEGPLVN